MSYPESHDEAILTRLIAGDTNALRSIIRQHWDALVAAAMITTNSADLASEAVQDAFIHLWESRATLDPARNVKGYLITVTRRRALNLVHHEQMHARMAYTLTHNTAHVATVSHNMGEHAIESVEFDAHIVAAINALPPRCREIFLLNRQAKMSYAEIATALGVTILTARNQMSLATQRIAQAIVRWRAGS